MTAYGASARERSGPDQAGPRRVHEDEGTVNGLPKDPYFALGDKKSSLTYKRHQSC